MIKRRNVGNCLINKVQRVNLHIHTDTLWGRLMPVPLKQDNGLITVWSRKTTGPIIYQPISPSNQFHCDQFSRLRHYEAIYTTRHMNRGLLKTSFIIESIALIQFFWSIRLQNWRCFGNRGDSVNGKRPPRLSLSNPCWVQVACKQFPSG